MPLLATPDIFELLKGIKWTSFHSLWPLHNVFGVFGGGLAEVARRWVKRRNARLAQHWPIADGMVQSIDVKTGVKFFGSTRPFNATFHYFYSVRDGSELNRYSGDFSRPFPDKERAWEWLEMLKNKQIRVHYQPGHPEVSTVLAADLDSHFSLPARSPEDLLFARPESYSQ